MTIKLDPKLEGRIREKTEAEGVSAEASVEHPVRADQAAEEELESLAIAGLYSRTSIEGGPGSWEKRHRRLEERLKRTGTRWAKRTTSSVPRLTTTLMSRRSPMRSTRRPIS